MSGGRIRPRTIVRRPGPAARWRLRVVAAVVGAVLLLLLLRGFYRRELYHLTGTAQWMWVTGEVAENRPTAGLFVQTLWLNERPVSATAKVCGDRQYVLWINGQPAMAGHNRPRFALDVVPVTDLLTAGANTIAVEARSHTSVGAVLLSLDLEPSPEGRRAGDVRGRNVLVSGPDWWVTTSWDGETLEAIPPDARHPWIWGRPPDHPWSYPVPVVHERPLVQAVVAEPQRLPAEAFVSEGHDLYSAHLREPVHGLLWLLLPPAGVTPWAVAVEAGTPGQPGVPVVLLAGQERWLYPGTVDGGKVLSWGGAPAAAIAVETAETRMR